MISRAWKELPDSERVGWQQKAKLDRERYEREKAAYKGPWKVPNVKDPNAPKKPMSAFLAFGNERRRAIATANPTMNGTEISCLLSKLWKECPEEVKKVYRDREATEREVFKRRRTEWLRKKKEAESESDSCSDLSDERHEQDSIEESGTIDNCSQSQQVSFSEQGPAIVGAPSDWDTTACLTFGALPMDYNTSNNTSNNTSISTNQLQQQQQQPSQQVNNVQQQAMFQPALYLSCNVNSPVFDPQIQTDLRTYPHRSMGVLDNAAILSNVATVSCTSSSSNTRKSPERFEHYSLEDILDDEELFEDFSPSDVSNFVPSYPRFM